MTAIYNTEVLVGVLIPEMWWAIFNLTEKARFEPKLEENMEVELGGGLGERCFK